MKSLSAAEKTSLSIQGDRVNLVGLDERHMPLIVGWRNDPGIRQWFFYRERFTPESQAAWFHHYLRDTGDVSFAIELKTGRAIGTVGLYGIDTATRSAEFGRIMIGEADCRGQRLGDEAARMCLRFGAENLGIERVFLIVHATNEAALALYHRLGFAETRRLDKEASDGTRHEAIELTAALRPL